MNYFCCLHIVFLIHNMSFNSGSLSRAGKMALFMVIVFCGFGVSAQESADKILAVVGRNRIILQSDLEIQAVQARAQDPKFNDSMKCLMLQQMILQKMLLEQAERD